jgi:hypothetical protein
MGHEKRKSLRGARWGLAPRAPLCARSFLGVLVLCAVLLLVPSAPAAQAALGFESLSSAFLGAGSSPETVVAGAHPESWSLSFDLDSSGPPGEERVGAALKELRVEMPPGLLGVTTSIPQCRHGAFVEGACPPLTAVGTIDLDASPPVETATLYLLEPPPGEVAQFGFIAHEFLPVTVDVSVVRHPPFPLVASLSNVPEVAQIFGATMRLEGAPSGTPFLVLPRSCAEPLRTGLTASSWEEPLTSVFATTPAPQRPINCGSLSYLPSLGVAPTTTAAASPSGLSLALDASDPGFSSLDGRGAADTRSATLVLPPGMTVDPAAATGLGVCTSEELEAEEPVPQPGQGCPKSSMLGSATVTTPLIPGTIEGSIYLARPEGAPSAIVTDAGGSHLTLELVLRSTERGVLLPLPIEVDADAQSGRLTASLEEIPQMPISHLEMHFNAGPRAPLTTPATCGSHSIAYSLDPSSGNPSLTGSQSFVTTSSECSPTFAPALSAGTVSNVAGRSSAFVLELGQSAAGPNPSAFDLTLPPGLSAALGSVAPCPDTQAASGACPAGSKLGYARIALGSGPEPLWVPPGEEPDSAVYLAGPYKGAPYSLVIVVPGQAGPLDLGAVVMRAPLAIDPATAQASISIEGLPQILSGVPLHYRTIRVVLDRPGFIRNPTSCEPTAITGGATAADGSTAAISTRFQAADCAALPFRPKLSLRFSGGVGRRGHPSVRAALRGDPEGAAISSASITLPRGELLDLRHLRGLCPRNVMVGDCPKSSLLGEVRLVTPLFDGPLAGSVYLRVPRHRLPEVSAEVRSGQLGFAVDGNVIDRKGRFGVKLRGLPDIPLTSAVLSLPGGRKGLVVNSRSLCGAPNKVAGSFTAHNGRQRQLGVRAQVKGRCRARRVD